jgi:hypothetical protein
MPNITKLVLKIIKSYGYDFYNEFIKVMYRNNTHDKKISYIINNIDEDPIYDLYKKYLNHCIITNNDFEQGKKHLGECRWNPFIFCSDLFSVLISCSNSFEYMDINKLLWENDILYNIIFEDYKNKNQKF